MYSPMISSHASRSPYVGGRRPQGTPLSEEEKFKIPDFGAINRAQVEAQNQENEVWSVVRPVVISQFLERTAFYGLQASMVLFLTKYLRMKSGDADASVGLWGGVCYMTPLIGGYIGDSILGRWRGIQLFFAFYIIGMVMVVLATTLEPDVSKMMFFPGIMILAFGMGGLKPLVSTFGADQINDERAKESFFNYLYWFQNMGAFVAFTLLVYICQDIGFTMGFALSCIFLILSYVILASGYSKYTMAPPIKESPVAAFFHVIYEGITRPGRNGAYAAVVDTDTDPATHDWLDAALLRNGGSHAIHDIEMVRKIGRVMPIFFLLVVYWGVNSQMATTFFNQGCQMNLIIPGTTIDVPVAALSLFDSVVIIILVPFFDSLVYPACEKYGLPCRTPLEKMRAGMALEVFIMFGAAVLEVYRRMVANYSDGLIGPSVCYSGDDVPQAANVSIFWQVPLFVLMGVSEILTSISSMDFFYSEAPEEMKGVCSALELVTVSLGQWMTAFLIPVANALPVVLGSGAWVPSDLNDGHLDAFFATLAVLVAINTGVFSAIAKRFSEDKDSSGTDVL